MKKKTYFALAGVVLGAALAVSPLPGLGRDGCMALGILLCAIFCWTGRVMPDFVAALGLCVLYILVCGVPMDTMFSAFSESSFWLLLSSFALSLGISRCGLLRRLSLFIMRRFPATFTGQALGLMAAGLAISPFIPNLSAKAAILAPIAMGISDAMGYAERSRQSGGLYLAMLTGIRTPSPAFISASVLGYAFLGSYPDYVVERFDMLHWLLAALPWFLIVSAVNCVLILKLYGPRRGEARAAADIPELHRPPEPMSRDEKIMLVIVLATMALWATESLHGIPAELASIAAMCVMLAAGLVSGAEFSREMNWGPLLFIGAVTGLAPAFAYLGIDEWIVGLCGPLLNLAGSSPALLLVLTGVFVIGVRFVIASEVAAVKLVLVLLVPISEGLGINPWVTGFAVYSTICPWFFLYQNPVHMTAFYSSKEKLISESSAAKYCAVYLAVSLLAAAACVPIWAAAGILYL